ncbi:MAG: LysM peptidoglycan-binding domain-containing protein [Anaerolineae bacterium]|nr:LysM peptidoglycan-binding domain-containing protein [Anaerolineae bacterium]
MLARRLSMLIVALLLLLAALPAAAQSERSYTVQPGDTIQSIASRFNVSVEALLIRNSIIDPNRIRRGQVLVIPGSVLTPPAQHVVQPGERLTDIALRYNTTVEALRQTNNLAAGATLVAGQVLRLPAVGGPTTFARTHVVDRGETLRIIAERYGTTWQALAAANNLTDPNRIMAGMTLVIPAVGGPVATPVPPAPPVVVPPAVPPRIYVVQRGDTLSGIALRLGVTPESLRQFNNIVNPSQLFAGQVLAVPPTGGPIVQPPAPPAPPAPVLPRRVVNGRYLVQPGDNLFAIAADFRVNIYSIAQANGLLNLNQIYTGQSLIIPGR